MFLQGFVFVQNDNIGALLLPTGAKKDYSSASHCANFSLTSGYTFEGDFLLLEFVILGK